MLSLFIVTNCYLLFICIKSIDRKDMITMLSKLLKIWIDFFTSRVILSFRHTKITMTDIKR